jgi:predicted MFS family arabinose efflux permease
VKYAGLAVAFSLFADMAMYTILPVYHERLGLSPIQVGILLSANRWIRLFTNHAAERLLARLSRRVLFTGALLLSVLLALVYASAPPFLLFLAARMLWGFCWSILRHAGTMNAVQGAENQKAGRSLGYYHGIVRIGFLLGTSVSGFLFDSLEFSTTFLFMALFTTIGVPFAIIAFKGSSPKSALPPVRKGIRLELQGFAIGAVGGGIIMSTLGKVLSSAAAGSDFAVGPLVLGIATVNGLILAVRHVFGIAGSPLLGIFIDRTGAQRSLLLFFVAAACALGFAALLPPVALLVVAVVVFFLCETGLQIALATNAGSEGPKRYARFVSALDLGAAAGPLIGWSIIQLSISGSGVFLAGAVIYFAGAAVSFFRRGETRR